MYVPKLCCGLVVGVGLRFGSNASDIANRGERKLVGAGAIQEREIRG